MNTIMQIHGEQLLKHGVFQADPHAGNFLLLDDGRIGLIDYGSTKRLVRGERLITCVLYAALARGDKDMIVDLCRNGGYKSLYFNEDVIYKLCRLGFDTYGKELLGDKNLQEFIDELYRSQCLDSRVISHLSTADPWLEVADNLVMAQFLSIRLRTVALQLNHPVVCSDYWGPLAEAQLVADGLPYEKWTPELMTEVTGDTLRISRGATASNIAASITGSKTE